MNTLPPITAALLEANGARATQVTLFRKHFGEGPAPLDDETVQELCALFSVEWASVALLPRTLRDAYEQAEAPLREAYKKARALAFVRIYRENMQ